MAVKRPNELVEIILAKNKPFTLYEIKIEAKRVRQGLENEVEGVLYRFRDSGLVIQYGSEFVPTELVAR